MKALPFRHLEINHKGQSSATGNTNSIEDRGRPKINTEISECEFVDRQTQRQPINENYLRLTTVYPID
ncbi:MULTISPECIES: hypothetical protein [unclassified Okeania]|uniref:hypothetical protein n=1 Tax=unclassified Okeania TaxID=2634635 RepID=UPI0013C121F7|nr:MULTISPECIES: hypothetical protein [unclassified Okeania]NES92474.1 hypothetical protein [Okeania sp. SIO2B9]NET42841.1 hypothetical protein [Okeania sp. SIO2B3]